MKSLIHRIHERCGDLWWYAILIFVACRSGDVIQAFIGLWLVPHYVPQSELGAALPLLQIGGAFGLPLSILVIPFSRWLTLYSARGEYGKVKRMLALAFRSVAIVFAIVLLSAHFIMPLFFERLRIEKGSLGVLIICTGLIGPFANVFNNALQGLKRFKTIAIINVVGAPVRLLVMLATMPFRALAGYMLGQMSAPLITIAVSWFSLRKELGGSVKSIPIGRSDGCAMLRYAAPLAVNMLIGTVLGTWQMLLFRQRLPEVESAAFYIISRLAEVSTYAGISLSIVAFPLATEAGEHGGRFSGLLWRFLGGTFLPGAAVMLVFALIGEPLLKAVPLWRDYACYWPLLALYTLRMAICTTSGAFATYETAAGRFTFMWYWIPSMLVETGGLVVLTGYGVFNGILPPCVVGWMESLNAARLDFFVWWLLCCAAVHMLMVACHILLRATPRRA